MPKYWNFVSDFGFKFSKNDFKVNEVKLLLENIDFIDQQAFDTDKVLLHELNHFEGFQGNPLGIVLVSPKKICGLCGEHLLVREDRPSFPMIYSTDGTTSGTHFRKYCSQNWKGCPFTQHYGFHQKGNSTEIFYDDDYIDLPFFMSTNMTVFETKMLQSLNAEILLGQLTYRQKSDIYNYCHGYDSSTKQGPIQTSHYEDYR